MNVFFSNFLNFFYSDDSMYSDDSTLSDLIFKNYLFIFGINSKFQEQKKKEQHWVRYVHKSREIEIYEKFFFGKF